jgi:head-tail adaptor
VLAQRLRHRCRIEQFADTQNPSTGEITRTWSTFANDVPIEIIPSSGREYLAGGGVQAGVDARGTVRELDGLVSAMRLIHVVNGVDKTTYEIKAVLPDPTFARHMTLMLNSGVSNG